MAPTATQAELKAAHRRLVRRHHPDLAAEPDRAAATRWVQEINVAYGLLRDPQNRAAYDRARKARQVGSAIAARRDAAAQEWEQMVASAGRWAGRWWRRHRVPLQRGAGRVRLTSSRGALRSRRVAAEALGRVLWLGWCVTATVGGWLLAISTQRLLGVDGVVTPLAGALGGLAVGNQQGWHLRLRLAGIRTPALTRQLGLLAWLAGLGAALWLDAILT